MKKLILICLFCVFSFTSAISQTFYGLFIDKNSDPIPFVQITDRDSNLLGVADEKGLAVFSLGKVKEIQVRSFFWENYSLKINPLNKRDTLMEIIQLKEKINHLAEVKIDNSNRLFLNSSGHVMDYFPLGNQDFLVLRENKNKYSLQIESTLNPTKFRQNVFGKPLALYKDFSNNFHIKYKDSLLQLYFIGDSLVIIDKVYKEKINAFTSILNIDSSYMYREELLNDMQYYLLSKQQNKSIGGEKKKKLPIYSKYDRANYQQILSYKREIISRYKCAISPRSNIISLGVWTGNLLELISDTKAFEAYSFLRHVIRKPLKISSFSTSFGLITFDLDDDSLYYFSYNNSIDKSIKIQFSEKKKDISVIQNEVLDEFYILNEVDYHVNVNKVNLSNGQVNLVYRFKNTAYPLKIKVYGDMLYYLARIDSGQLKLFKASISKD